AHWVSNTVTGQGHTVTPAETVTSINAPEATTERIRPSHIQRSVTTMAAQCKITKPMTTAALTEYTTATTGQPTARRTTETKIAPVQDQAVALNDACLPAFGASPSSRRSMVAGWLRLPNNARVSHASQDA